MKYWWLEKYKNFKIVQIVELCNDVNYFLVMPKNYKKKYLSIKDKTIDSLEEEELLILLKVIVTTKNIKDNTLILIIDKLLLIPDNSFPPSDYSILEELNEIKKLKDNYPYEEKISVNNIAVCYNCLNVFYVDKIKNVNKNKLCLCPFCLKDSLYFDNDYIPMNYTFIKLANLYYGISKLGCNFKNIQKIIRKNLESVIGTNKTDFINISDIYSINKFNPLDEKIFSRKLLLNLYSFDEQFVEMKTIFVPTLNCKNKILLLTNIIITIMETLSTTVYLKKIRIVFECSNDLANFSNLIATIIKYKYE